MTHINSSTIAQFLSAFGGDTVYARCIDDAEDKPKAERLKPVSIQEPMEAAIPALIAQNESERSCFLTINQTDGKGVSAGNMVAPRAVWIDYDTKLDRPLNLIGLPKASLVVTTPGGSHHYWLLSEPCEWDVWEKAMKSLIRHTGSDPVVKDRARIMRIPGLAHWKTGKPLPVTLDSFHPDRRYTVSEVVDGLAEPVTPKPEPKRVKAPKKAPKQPKQAKRPNKHNGVRVGLLGGVNANIVKDAMEVVLTAADGNRNNTLSQQAYRVAFLFDDYPEVAQMLIETGRAIGLTPTECEATLKSAHTAYLKAQEDGNYTIPTVVGQHLQLIRLYEPRLNVRTGRIILKDGSVHATAQSATRQIERACGCYFQHGRKFEELLDDESKQNVIDPFLDYLDELPGVDKATALNTLSTLTELVTGRTDPIGEAYLRCFLLGIVARAYEPGSKHDTMLILVGSQGGGKSTWLNFLLPPDLVREAPTSFTGGKDDFTTVARTMSQACVAIMDEFDRVQGRKLTSEVKAELTKSDDFGRTSYSREPELFLRRAVFYGTTNSHQLLKDATGDRRYHILKTERSLGNPIPFDQVAALKDAVWCAAVSLWRADPSLARLSGNEEVLRSQSNQSYQDLSEDVAHFLGYLEELEATTAANLSFVLKDMCDALNIRLDRVLEGQIKAHLSARGYEFRQLRSHGRKRVWAKGDCPIPIGEPFAEQRQLEVFGKHYDPRTIYQVMRMGG